MAVAVIMVVIVVVAVIMAMVVTVMVIVVMIVIMVTVIVGVLHQRRFHILGRGLHQLLDGDLLLRRLGLLEDVVDHLFLEDRRAQVRERSRVLLVVLVDELFLAGITPRLLDQGPLQFFLVDLQLLPVADLTEQEPQPHAPLGNLAVISLQLILGFSKICKRLALVLEGVIEAAPDAFELSGNQRFRQREGMRAIERIENLALDLGARDGLVFRADAAFHQLFQVRQGLRPQRLGEVVVDLGTYRLGHFLDGDGELGVLAGDFLGRIILRERYLDEALLARLAALQALHEARNEAGLAHDERHVLALAAFELLAVDAAHEVNRQTVALAGGTARLRLMPDGALDQIVHRLVDGFLADLGHFLLELQCRQVGDLEVRQHLERHGVGEVALPGDHALDLILVLGELDVGLMGGALVAIRHGLAAGFIYRLLHHLRHQRAAVQLLDMGDGDLALAEPLDLDLILDLVDARGEALAELALSDDNLQLALEAS